MSKRKTLIGVCISFLALLVVSYLFLSFYFTSERLKKLVIPKLEAYLNREVKIERIQFNPLKGIEIKKFELKEPPKWSSKTFISCDRLVLKYRFWPLLSKRLEIDTLILKKPFISIVKDKKGKFNFIDLLNRSQGKKESAPVAKKKSPFELLVSKVEIEDGYISYQDLATQKAVNLTKLNFEAKDINLNYSFPFKATFSLNGLTGKIKGKINLSNLGGELYLRLFGDNFASFASFSPNFIKSISGKLILELHLKGNMLNAQVKGNVLGKGLALILISGQKIPNLNFKTNLIGNWENEQKKFCLNSFSFSLNKFLITGHGNFGKEMASFTFNLSSPDISRWVKIYPKSFVIKVLKGKLQGKGIITTDYRKTIRGQFKLHLSNLTLKNQAGKTSDFQVELANSFCYHIVQQKLVLTQGQLDFNHTSFLFSGTVSPSWIALNLKSAQLELADFYFLFPKLSAIKGIIKLDLVLKGNPHHVNFPTIPSSHTPKKPNSISLPFSAKGKISSENLRYGEIQFTQFVCPYILQKNILILSPIYGELLKGGYLKGKVNINLRDLTYQGTIKIKQVNLANVAPMFLPPTLGSINGEGNIEAVFKGKEFTLDSLEKYLNAQATLFVKDGAFIGNPTLKAIAAFLDMPELAQLHFHQMNGSVHIVDGNVQLNTTANRSEYGLSIKGYSSLKGKLNLKIQLRLSPHLIQKSRQKKVLSFVSSRDKAGNYIISLLVTGDIKSPEVKLDKEIIKEKLKEKGEKKMKKFFKEKLKIKGFPF